MAYVLMRRGKFISSHSYATGRGFRFSWTADEANAQRFADGDPTVDLFRNLTGASIERRQNTKSELREIGRERCRIRDAGYQAPSIHTKINRRAAQKGGAA